MFKTRKVVIVGAGHVGSHVALALIQSGEADDIVLIDILKEKAIGQALCQRLAVRQKCQYPRRLL